MSYSVITRDFNDGKWISAPESFLLTSENIKSIEGAKWVWNLFYARFFSRKYFTLDKVEKTTAHFICDNIFDFYVNGNLISFEQKEMEADITEFLKKGENRINIRFYQSAEDRFFTSAFIGEIKSDSLRIVTDES